MEDFIKSSILPDDPVIKMYFRFWSSIFSAKILTRKEVFPLLQALGYSLGSSKVVVDEYLRSIKTSNRIKSYDTIRAGLHLLCSVLSESDSEYFFIKELISGLPSTTTKLEVLLEEATKFPDNEKKWRQLLTLTLSNSSMNTKVLKLDSMSSEKTIYRDLLSSTQFFLDIAGIVLDWCYQESNKLFCQLQNVFSHPNISQHQKNKNNLDIFLSWVTEQMENFFHKHMWEAIEEPMSIAYLFVKRIEANLSSFSAESFAFLNSIIEIVRTSVCLENVIYILQKDDITVEQMFKELIVSNFHYLLKIHFDTIPHDVNLELLKLDIRLLHIFYNVFLEDQYNKRTNISESVNLISSKEFFQIMKWLDCIEQNPNVCSILCQTTLSLWEKELINIHLNQFVSAWTDISMTEKQNTVHLMNRIRLDNGIGHKDIIAFLNSIRAKYLQEPNVTAKASIFLNLLEDVYYKRVSFEEACTIVKEYDYQQWFDQLNKFKSRQVEEHQTREVEEIIRLIEHQIKTGSYTISVHKFSIIAKEVTCAIERVQDNSRASKATFESKFEIDLHEFISSLQKNQSIKDRMNWLDNNHRRLDFVVYIVTTWMLTNHQLPYFTQITSLLLFLHSTEKGLLQQVKTGEGKTLIVGMLAAVKALLGYKVDVVSSNSDLAREGLKKCKRFFCKLGLDAGVNCTEDNDTNKQAYKSHIVYGDVGSFQRDVLTDESKPGNTSFRARYSNLQSVCLIVDEVDSMFLDKGQHMLYLAHETPALKHLQTLFIVIWSSVLGSRKKSLPISLMVDELARQLTILIGNETIPVPKYLHEFCKQKMKSWVNSAHEALIMEADDQFIIDYRTGSDDTREIFPIDKQTGIEQYNMKWTDGLSQFLELKYRRKVSTENLRAVFISNKRFFKRYGNNLFGLTGTLGSTSSRNLLQQVYSIDTVELPTNRAKRFEQARSQVASDRAMWLEKILWEINQKIQHQPVLVICENIRQLTVLKSYLQKKKLRNIIDYARAGDDIEERFRAKGGATSGQIILATNKGGRGTDIIVNEKQVSEGLHVIVSFLPINTRIEEQAFGRAARAGQAGSGCLVIEVDVQQYKQLLSRFQTIEEATEIIVEKEKERRDRYETERLSRLLTEDIPQLDLEEKLYELFQKKKEILLDFPNSKKIFGTDRPISQYTKKACADIITNKWAFWLESMRSQIRCATTLLKRQEIQDMFEDTFSSQEITIPSDSSDSPFFAFPEDYTLLGHAFLKEISETDEYTKEDNDIRYKAALLCFERACDKGDQTGSPSMTACYCFVKLHPEPTKQNKQIAHRYLKKAQSHLNVLKQRLMENLESSKIISGLIDVSQFVHIGQNYFTEQIEGKIKVIGLHLHMLELLMGTSLNEVSFVNDSTVTDELITEEMSREVYQALVSSKIICHNKVRCYWKKSDRTEQLLKKFARPFIVEKLGLLIKSKEVIEESDLVDLVYSSDELWAILNPLMETPEDVLILNVEDINAKLSESSDYCQSWEKLKQEFETQFTGHSKLYILCQDPIFKKLHTEEFKELMTHFKNNALCIFTTQGKLKVDALELLETMDLKKYEQCVACSIDEDAVRQQLREYLVATVGYCNEFQNGYINENMLPFGKKTDEVTKLHTFLLEQNILKSGQLTMHKYDSCNNELHSSVKKALKKRYSKEQISIIFGALQSLRGEIRSFEHELEVGWVKFDDLKDHPLDVPEELYFFTSWHLDHFLIVEQAEKSWWDWNAFACAMLGLAQVAAGVCLVTLTAGIASTIGARLMSEGKNDMVYATIAGLKKTFSWRDFAILKGINLVIAVATGGIELLSSIRHHPKIDSAASSSNFVKTVSEAACRFVRKATTSIITDVVLSQAQQLIVDKISEKIMSTFHDHLTIKLKERLVLIAKRVKNDNEFIDRTKQMLDILQKLFNLKSQKTFDAFKKISTQVLSSFEQHFKDIPKQLCNSHPTIAKLLSHGLTAASLANYVFNVVEYGIKVMPCVNAIISEFQEITNETTNELRTDVNEELIDREMEKMAKVVHEGFKNFLKKKLRTTLHTVVQKSLTQFAEGGKEHVSFTTQSTFCGKTTAEVVAQMVEYDTMDDSSVADPPPEEKLSKHTEFLQRRDELQRTIIEPKNDEKGITPQQEQRSLPTQLAFEQLHNSKQKKSVPSLPIEICDHAFEAKYKQLPICGGIGRYAMLHASGM